MTLSIALLVLFAALLHASWNAVLKRNSDGLWTMSVMGMATCLACAALVPFLPLPATASWPYIGGSALLHVGYNIFLVRAYRRGDFGSAYPIARGSSPLLVTLGAALIAKELPAWSGIAGILLVSIGIISLAFRGRRLPDSGILYALGTGAFIAAYSVTDGMGGRLSGNTPAYTLWLCLLWGATAQPIYLVRRPGLCPLARLAPNRSCGGRRHRIAFGLWHRHLCHDASAHGFGFGLAGNQRPVRRLAGADIFR